MSVGRVTTDEHGRVIACPECDGAGKVRHRLNDNVYAGDPDDAYSCGECGATFDEYVEREAKKAGGGMRAKYEHLSLEDVGLEGMEG